MSSAFSPHDPFGVNSPLPIHSVVVEENVSVRPREAFLAHGMRGFAISATSRSQPGGEVLQEDASFFAEQHSM
jgi:hypothetical protein